MRFELALAVVVPLALAAPVITPRAGTVIPGKYIVKFQSDAVQDVIEGAIKLLEKEPEHIYSFGTYRGIAAELSDNVVDLLAALPGVEYIEKDAIVKANLGTIEKRAYTTQSDSPWGLGRISHVSSGTTTYTYDTTAGAGTCVYIIDTGIQTDHPEFEGRATWLANYAGDGSNTDGNGHGTHCAGTIGSKTYGVSKKTSLFAVKVLDASGSGSNSGVIAGINYVANDQKTRSACSGGAVGSMSLGGSKSTAVNTAAANAVTAGLFLAVAAGNDNADASNYSPASEASAFTVGATDKSDAKASFSNYGALVDVFAPGVSILSTWINSGTNTISGTSMATPHVAGLAAYLLGFEGKKTPAVLSARIIALSNKNKITGLPSGTANNLAFNGNPSG